MKFTKLQKIIMCLGFAVLIAIAAFAPNSTQEGKNLNMTAPASGNAAPTVGGPFTLVDHNGAVVTEASFPGYKLVFFGFTHCPDVCPAGLQKMSMTLKALGADGEKLQPLFITVDPERDNAEIMKAYVSLYDDRLVGLTGTKDQIDSAIETFRVYAAKADNADPETYTLYHSSYMYLLKDNGEMITVFSADDPIENITKEIKEIIK
jgi:cytochrome oxidase Cu insertion factor (SCO1/SenC/PrrC family)